MWKLPREIRIEKYFHHKICQPRRIFPPPFFIREYVRILRGGGPISRQKSSKITVSAGICCGFGVRTRLRAFFDVLGRTVLTQKKRSQKYSWGEGPDPLDFQTGSFKVDPSSTTWYWGRVVPNAYFDSNPGRVFLGPRSTPGGVKAAGGRPNNLFVLKVP